MKRILLSASLLLSLTASAQTALPYFTGFDNVAQQINWAEYRSGDENQFYRWDYTNMMSYSAPGCVIHNYPVGGQDLLDDWFVSPEFDFAGGGMLDSVRYSFSGFGVPGPGDTVAIYLLHDSPDPDFATKTLLMDFRDTDYIGDGAWRRLDPIALPAQSGSSYIAIRYSTVVNWLDVRFDNIAVSGSSAGLNEGSQRDAFVYPNPSNGEITIQLNEKEQSAGLELFDAAGKIVFAQTIVSQEKVYPRLSPGMYTYRITGSVTATTGRLVVR